MRAIEPVDEKVREWKVGRGEDSFVRVLGAIQGMSQEDRWEDRYRKSRESLRGSEDGSEESD